MIPYARFGVLLWLVTASAAFGQQANDVVLGKLANGATVTFTRSAGGDFGIEIGGGTAPAMSQPKPAQVELYRGGDNASQLTAGYQTVQPGAENEDQKQSFVVGKVKLTEGKAAFEVEDRWRLAGGALALSRKVSVTITEENAGFYSAMKLYSTPGPALHVPPGAAVRWTNRPRRPPRRGAHAEAAIPRRTWNWPHGPKAKAFCLIPPPPNWNSGPKS